jgi:hypothetical protein
MDPQVLAWVKAFYAARKWSLEGTDPSGDADLGMGQLRVDREKLVALGAQLHKYPPEDVPTHLWDEANGAIQTLDDAIAGRDVSAGQAAVSRAAAALNAIAVWRPDPGFVPSGRVSADTKLNDGWHKADVPVPGRMSFGLRCETDDQGVISGLRLAGRPAGKHGGAQGQHVTAFVTVRAAAVGAVHGRDMEGASANVAHLFKGLLDYPAFGPEAPEAGLDPEMLATVRGLARKDPAVTERFTLETAMAYYVEVRDALPGASLAVDMSLGGHSSVAGKGEGTFARTLDDIDAQVRATPKANRTDLPEPDAQRALAAMKKLYDPGAVARLADPVKQRNALDTFVMSMAQAYPDLFTCPTAGGTIGARLAEAVMGAVAPPAPTDGPDVIDARARRADLMARAGRATEFPAPAGPGKRPEPSGHSAGLVPPEGAGPLRIEFDGRPEGSIKSGGSMGDHTSSMRLMKSSLSGALLGDDTAIPNAHALAVRLQAVLDQFDPDDYAELFVDAEDDASELAFPHNERLEEMSSLHSLLSDLQKDLAKGPDRVVAAGEFLKLAEDLLALIDQRPGAVHYSGPAGGHSEGTVGSACDLHEAALRSGQQAGALPDAAINDLMELFDAKSASNLMSDDDIIVSDRSDDFIDVLIDEFLWFAGLSYPLLVAALGKAVIRDELNAAIRRGAKKARKGAKKRRVEDGDDDWGS